jgi:hypothetical protein
MKLSQCLMWWRRAAKPRVQRPRAPDWVDAGTEPSPQQLDDILLGCGWFDSSHELNAGLLVTEHLTPERVANEVPLGWWLDWQACGSMPASAQRRGLPG